MPHSLDIDIKTLTPLWTGGIEGTCDQLHISGLMGSLRYWYEAIIRGTGGYACDPSEGKGCVYDAKLKEKSICAACYLFGTTGWARLFRLTALVNGSPTTVAATEPLHFQSFTDMNQTWLQTVFEGTKNGKPTRSPVTSQYALYSLSPITLSHRWRQVDRKYAESQIVLLYWFLVNFAGFGAKQQFGFGQIAVEKPSLNQEHWKIGLRALKGRLGDFRPLQASSLQQTREKVVLRCSDLADFFWLDSHIADTLAKGRKESGQIVHADAYISSAFDIRYKTDRKLGFRAWLEKNRNPHDSRNPLWSDSMLRVFLGASTRKGELPLRDEERTASRVFVSMPYKIQGRFRLRLYGFALPDLSTPDGNLTAEKAAELCTDYLTFIGATNISSMLGSNLLMEARI